MQSKVKPQSPAAVKPRYPRLMQIKDKHCFNAVAVRKIVLFTEYNTGVVVGGTGEFDYLGTSHSWWEESKFEDFDGIVELSN